ncbi:MAG TPA: hypothetical protein PLH72_05525 [Vicinamibacterales bacterium]|nr:hypothetical protein [Vicinamibacterales bacterium]
MSQHEVSVPAATRILAPAREEVLHAVDIPNDRDRSIIWTDDPWREARPQDID